MENLAEKIVHSLYQLEILSDFNHYIFSAIFDINQSFKVESGYNNDKESMFEYEIELGHEMPYMIPDKADAP